MEQKQGTGSRRGLVALFLLSLFLAGCTTPREVASRHPFRVPADTLAFANETVWRYKVDPIAGVQEHERKKMPPRYALHCFAMSRITKEFFLHARFIPDAPPLDGDSLRRRIRQVVVRGPRHVDADELRVEIPGFADLWELSTAQPDLLKAEAGGSWRSYFQRGNWRMVLPFTAGQRGREASRIADELGRGNIAVVHLFTFPALRMNHALVVHAVRATDAGWSFDAYDPNAPGEPLVIDYDARTAHFRMPPTHYTVGGDVDAYEVYRDWFH